MNATEVELLVRGVLVHLGLPFTVLSVIGSPAGWNIVVRERRRRTDPLPTFPEIRNLVRQLMATLFLLERPQWLNLPLSFQRNPPLRI